jgi:hypothetical protein
MPIASVATRIIDVAGLEHLDLGVARARAERAQHHGGAAALAADQFGDGIDLVAEKATIGRAPRQAGDLRSPANEQHRHARPRDDVGAGQQLRRRSAAHGRGAEQQRLLAPARCRMRSVKTWPRSRSAGELDLVDREKAATSVSAASPRRCRPSSAASADDLLLAGDQRDLVGADPRHDRGCRPRARAGAAAGRSCRRNARASARWRDGSCRCWSARGRPYDIFGQAGDDPPYVGNRIGRRKRSGLFGPVQRVRRESIVQPRRETCG